MSLGEFFTLKVKFSIVIKNINYNDFTKIKFNSVLNQPILQDTAISKPKPPHIITKSSNITIKNRIKTDQVKLSKDENDTIKSDIQIHKDYKLELNKKTSRRAHQNPFRNNQDTTELISKDKLNAHSQTATHLPNNNMISSADFFNSIIGPLVVAAITGLATWLWTKNFVKKSITVKYQTKVESAPVKYVEELDRLINKAVTDGPTNAIVNARAIVAARNSLRDSLITISKQLNSEIDQLEQNINDDRKGKKIFKLLEEDVNRNFGLIDPSDTYETIRVLHAVWPTKKVQIVVEVRKLITELGLNEIDN